MFPCPKIKGKKLPIDHNFLDEKEEKNVQIKPFFYISIVDN